MDLRELQIKVNRAVNRAIEDGNNPKNIKVSIQIDGPGEDSIWADSIEVNYDNNCNVSGCVISGDVP